MWKPLGWVDWGYHDTINKIVNSGKGSHLGEMDFFNTLNLRWGIAKYRYSVGNWKHKSGTLKVSSRGMGAGGINWGVFLPLEMVVEPKVSYSQLTKSNPQTTCTACRTKNNFYILNVYVSTYIIALICLLAHKLKMFTLWPFKETVCQRPVEIIRVKVFTECESCV